MSIKVKKVLITTMVICLFWTTTMFADVWGTITTSAYVPMTSAQKVNFNQYADVRLTQGPVEGHCKVMVYLRRTDDTSYRTEIEVYQNIGLKQLSYQDDNFYYGNYYHKYFELMSKIEPSSFINVSYVGGEMTP